MTTTELHLLLLMITGQLIASSTAKYMYSMRDLSTPVIHFVSRTFDLCGLVRALTFVNVSVQTLPLIGLACIKDVILSIFLTTHRAFRRPKPHMTEPMTWMSFGDIRNQGGY